MDEMLIKNLATARDDKDKVKSIMKTMLEAVTSTQDYKDLEAALQESVQIEAEALEAVQKAAFAEFEATENKHPHEAVEIKEYHEVSVPDPARAVEWCIANFTPALSLDEKTFVDLARRGKVPAELFVETPTWKATIMRNLSKYIGIKEGFV